MKWRCSSGVRTATSPRSTIAIVGPVRRGAGRPIGQCSASQRVQGPERRTRVRRVQDVAGVEVGVHQVVVQQHLEVNVDAPLHDVVPLRARELRDAPVLHVVGERRRLYVALDEQRGGREQRLRQHHVAPRAEAAPHRPQLRRLALQAHLRRERAFELRDRRLDVEPAEPRQRRHRRREQLSRDGARAREQQLRVRVLGPGCEPPSGMPAAAQGRSAARARRLGGAP